MEMVQKLMMTCATLKVFTDYTKRDIHVLLRNRIVELRERNYFVYKIITYPIRGNILYVNSKLEKCIIVLVDLAKICVMAWYLCKGHLAMRSGIAMRNCVEQLYENFCECVICEVVKLFCDLRSNLERINI